MLCRRCAPVPQGHLIAAHHGSGKRRKRWLPPVGTIEPSVLGSHTASPAQAANRSSLALAGWVAFEKKAAQHFVLGYFHRPRSGTRRHASPFERANPASITLFSGLDEDREAD